MSEDNTIHLEGRYFRAEHEPRPLSLRCSSITFHNAVFKETGGADGSVMRSVVEQPSLVASGLPAEFNRAKGDFTHIACDRLPRGEGELIAIEPLNGDRARFVVKYSH